MSYKLSKYSDQVTSCNRDGTRTIQLGEYFYSLGGWIPGKSFNDIYRTKDLRTWSYFGTMPVGIHTFGLEMLSEKIYIYGGDINNRTMNCYMTYDFKEYFNKGIIPFGQRVLYGSCSDGVYMYLAGGMSNENSYTSTARDVLRSVDGSVWEKMSDGFPAIGRCVAGSMCYFQGGIHFVGGGIYQMPDPPKERYVSYDQGRNFYRVKDYPFTGRSYNDTREWDGKLWSIGGYNRVNLPDMEWQGGHAHGLNVFNDKLVISNGNFKNDCWVIERV